MVDNKYYKMEEGKRVKRHYNLKCLTCGLITYDIPVLIVQALEKFPKTQELRCSKGCNTRGTLTARAPNEDKGDPGSKANWQITEVPEAHPSPGSYELPKKDKSKKKVEDEE